MCSINSTSFINTNVLVAVNVPKKRVAPDLSQNFRSSPTNTTSFLKKSAH